MLQNPSHAMGFKLILFTIEPQGNLTIAISSPGGVSIGASLNPASVSFMAQATCHRDIQEKGSQQLRGVSIINNDSAPPVTQLVGN